MSATTFIYALRDPESNEVRYIGKANNPHKRLVTHRREVKLGRKHYRANWLVGGPRDGQTIVYKGEIASASDLDKVALLQVDGQTYKVAGLDKRNHHAMLLWQPAP